MDRKLAPAIRIKRWKEKDWEERQRSKSRGAKGGRRRIGKD